MKKTIKLKDVDPVLFAGTADSNLTLIENKLVAKITLRGDKLYLEGKKDDISKAESLISDMISTINLKGYIDEEDIETLLYSK